MTQVVRNQWPNCGVRLDLPRSISVFARAIVAYNLSAEGRLEGEEAFITKRGSFRCAQCGARLDKFIKRLRVGVMGGRKDAAANGSADV